MSAPAVMTTLEERLERIESGNLDPLDAVEAAHHLADPAATLAELARRGRAQAIAAAHDIGRLPYHTIGAELGVSKPMVQQMVYLGREPWDPPRRPPTQLGDRFDQAAGTESPVLRARRYQDLSEYARGFQKAVTHARARAVRRAILLGHTQQQVADRIGVTKTLIGQIDALGRKLLG